MPQYAALIYSEESTTETSPEEWEAVMAAYNQFGKEAGEAGVLRGGEALQGTATATTVHVKGGVRVANR